jgi:hypothetical protein
LYKVRRLPDNQLVYLSRVAVFAVLLAGLVFAGDKGFTPPRAQPAQTYPAHESHPDEKVTIGLDLYNSSPKNSIFKIKYKDYDLLPVRLIISNDGDKPLMLDHIKIQLITAQKEKIPVAVRDDLLRKLARPEKVTNRPRVGLPIPVPRDNKPISKDAREEIDSAMFVNVPVSPHALQSGFLFFDVSGIENPQEQAHIFISGIKAGSQELFYFDIPLDQVQERPAPPKTGN